MALEKEGAIFLFTDYLYLLKFHYFDRIYMQIYEV